MLLLADVLDWDTKHPGDRMKESLANGYLLNTNRMINLVDTAFGDEDDATRMLFSNNPNDPRDSPDRLVISGTVAQIRVYHDTPYFSKFAVLSIYPTLDVTNPGTPVETLIEWENIAYVYRTYNDYTHDRCHVVYYDESWKRKVVIVNHTLTGVLLIAITGNDLD